MKGWLVVNAFLNAQKFSEIYGMLLASAKLRDIDLQLFTNAQLLKPICENFAQKPDFVLFWDKDIPLARAFERESIPTFNCADAILACDNKILTAQTLSIKHIPHPITIVAPQTFDKIGYENTQFLDSVADKLEFPIVVKEAFGSFGQQVYLAQDMPDLRAICARLAGKLFIFQQFISESRGRDVRVNVVGDRVVCAMERYNPSDFRSNITNGGKMRKIELSSEQAQVAVDAVKALGLDFAGVDVLFGKSPVVCEVNSNPHFKSSLECTGVDLSAYIIDLIRKKLCKAC